MCFPKFQDSLIESIETPAYDVAELIALEASLARGRSFIHHQERIVPGYPTIIITAPDSSYSVSEYDSVPDYANVDQSALLPAGWDMWRGPPDASV